MGISTLQAFEEACEVSGRGNGAIVVFLLPETRQAALYRDEFVGRLAPGALARTMLGRLDLTNGGQVMFYTNDRSVRGLNAVFFRAIPGSRDATGRFEWETDTSSFRPEPFRAPPSRFERIDNDLV